MPNNVVAHYMRATNLQTDILQVSSSAIMYSLNPSVNENHSCLIYANPLFSPLLVISFSSIKLTVLVTHDGVHYHDNEGNDGREEERNGGGGVRGGVKSLQGQLSHEDF